MVVTIGYRMIHFGHNHFVAQFRSSSKLMMVFVEQCKIAKKSTLYVPCAASALAFVDRTIRQSPRSHTGAKATKMFVYD